MALTSGDLDLARRLVEGAGQAALGVRQRDDLRATTKSGPTDVVTEADLVAERSVVDLLARERPDDAVLGEEGAVRPGSSGRTWVIDPVDGTYNFLRGSRRWCSAVALSEAEVPLLGAVASPTSGEVTVGGPGLGVQTIDASGQVSTASPLLERDLSASALLTYLHPPFHDDVVGESWRRLVAGVATLRMTGSGSLDALDVVRGRADLVVHHSAPVWDRWPGQALLCALGGEARLLTAAGVEWYVAGHPRAVAQACELLTDR